MQFGIKNHKKIVRIWRIWHNKRYAEKPQGTKLSIEDAAVELFPAITICPLILTEFGYKKDVLDACGEDLRL